MARANPSSRRSHSSRLFDRSAREVTSISQPANLTLHTRPELLLRVQNFEADKYSPNYPRHSLAMEAILSGRQILLMEHGLSVPERPQGHNNRRRSSSISAEKSSGLLGHGGIRDRIKGRESGGTLPSSEQGHGSEISSDS